MPYLKFSSAKRGMNLGKLLQNKISGEIEGLIALVNDPIFDLLLFISNPKYIDLIDKQKTPYVVISNTVITAPYSEILKKQYPQYVNDL